MNKIDQWTSTFEKFKKAVKTKVDIYSKELAEYDMMTPSDKVRYKGRVIELRKLIEYYDDILFKYEDDSIEIPDTILGDVYISGNESSNDVAETEYGDFSITYQKSKEELIDEYYEVIHNLNVSKKNDKNHVEKYKQLAEQLYFKYALLIERAPKIRTGIVHNEKLMVRDEDYQLYINQYHLNRIHATNVDVEREKLVSKLNLIKGQYMNFSNINSAEKNALKVEMADLKSKIATLKAEKNKYDMLAEVSLLKAKAAEGVLKNDYCVYFIAKLDADDRVNRELSNIEAFKYDIEKIDAELTLLTITDNIDDATRQKLLNESSSLSKMKDIAYADLSRARKQRLKQEILHAFNVGSLSKEAKDEKLNQLEQYIVINEAVEKEVGLYVEREEPTVEEPAVEPVGPKR